MRKYLIGAAALVCAMTVASCEQEYPEIDFSHTTSIVSDYSGIIKALNDMSLGLEEKMELIEDAIKSQTLSIGQKMDILTKAVDS